MRHSRKLRVVGHGVRLLLAALAALAAIRFFWDAVTVEGLSPRSVFALILLSGGVSLVWRGTVDFRRAVSRLRAGPAVSPIRTRKARASPGIV